MNSERRDSTQSQKDTMPVSSMTMQRGTTRTDIDMSTCAAAGSVATTHIDMWRLQSDQVPAPAMGEGHPSLNGQGFPSGAMGGGYPFVPNQGLHRALSTGRYSVHDGQGILCGVGGRPYPSTTVVARVAP